MTLSLASVKSDYLALIIEPLIGVHGASGSIRETPLMSDSRVWNPAPSTRAQSRRCCDAERLGEGGADTGLGVITPPVEEPTEVVAVGRIEPTPAASFTPVACC